MMMNVARETAAWSCQYEGSTVENSPLLSAYSGTWIRNGFRKARTNRGNSNILHFSWVLQTFISRWTVLNCHIIYILLYFIVVFEYGHVIFNQ